jgi:O-antigen ligase
MSSRRRGSDTLLGRITAGFGGLFSAAVLLAFALMLGGASREAYAVNGVLQAFAGLVLFTCALSPVRVEWERAYQLLIALAGLVLAVTVVQLIPLPPVLWTHLPGRVEITRAFDLLGLDRPVLPLSLAPQDTLLGLGRFLPPLAILACASRIRALEEGSALRWVIVTVAAASCLLGLLQVLTGQDSILYVYEFTNWGQPVGFMANVNHQACFLLMAMPFLAATAARLEVRYGMGDADTGLAILIGLIGLLLVLGVMVAGSGAGYIFLAPTLLFSVLVYRRRAPGLVGLLMLGGSCILIAILGFITASSPILVGLGIPQMDWETELSLGRPGLFARTFEAIRDTFPFGIGLGSFEEFYPRYENPDTIPVTFANHAHNDYLEFTLEYGLLGVILIIAGLVWVVWRTKAAWQAGEEEGARLARASSVALGVVLLHSMVDYPLRTGAIACLAALCCVFLGQMKARSVESTSRRRASRSAPSETARHVEL